MGDGAFPHTLTDPRVHPSQLGAAAMQSLELACAVLAHPSVTPRILGCIAMRWPELGPRLARHPRTRRRLLAALAGRYPDDFFANPAAEAHVRSPRSLPMPLVAKLLEHEAAPAWLVPALFDHPLPAARVLAARAITAPSDAARLACDPQPAVRAAAAANEHLPSEAIDLLACDPDPRVREAIVVHGDAAPHVVAQLASDNSAAVRARLAEHVRAREPLEQLANDPEEWVRTRVAANLEAPHDLLCGLAQDPCLYVRLAVARNEHAPARALELLLGQPQAPGQRWNDPRIDAIRHPNMTTGILFGVVRSPEVELRKCVAGNPRLSPELIDLLATDEDRWVRWALAYHQRDAAVLARLARDLDPLVRSQAIEHSADAALVALAARDPDAGVREHVAASAVASPEVLARLAADPAVAVRRRVAYNPRTPASAVARLALDSDDEIAHGALRNDALPFPVLIEVLRAARRPEMARIMVRYRLRAAGTPDSAFEAVHEGGGPAAGALLAELASLPATIADRLERSTSQVRAILAEHTPDLARVTRLARDPDPHVRAAAAARARAHPAVVAMLAGDPDPRVRSAIARLATDAAVLESYTRDPDPWVRRLALGNPALPLRVLLRTLRRGDEEASWARATLVAIGHPKGGRRRPKD